MPLVKRAVSPVNISQVPVPNKIDNELEYVFNASLCNLMRQLASLSRQANDIFNDLGSEINAICQRTHSMQLRLRNLEPALSATIKQQLEPGAEGSETPQLPAYESRPEVKSQTVDRASMPRCIQVLYEQCEPPPPLSIVNQFRSDNKDSAKMYSDPTFFFELWRKEMLSQDETKTKKTHQKRNRGKSGGGRKKSKAVSSAQSPPAPGQQSETGTGRDMSQGGSPSKYSQGTLNKPESDSSSLSTSLQRGSSQLEASYVPPPGPVPPPPAMYSSSEMPIAPNELPPPPPMDMPGGRNSMGVDQYLFDDSSPYARGNLQNLPPPPNFMPYSPPLPPPPLPNSGGQDTAQRSSDYLPPSPPPLPHVVMDNSTSPPIPPAPPLPLPTANVPKPPPPPGPVAGVAAAAAPKANLPSVPPARNDLLDSIRRGVQLKPVQDTTTKKDTELSTVGKIMAEVERRRLLMLQGNNSSESSADEWDSDD